MDTVGDPKRRGNTATAAGLGSHDGTKARQTRVPRQPTAKKVRDARTAAQAVLASAGVTDEMAKLLGHVFQTATTYLDPDAPWIDHADTPNAWLDVQRIQCALNGMELATEGGKLIRAKILEMLPFRLVTRFLRNELLDRREKAAAEYAGTPVYRGMVLLPLANPSRRTRRGRRIDVGIENAVGYGESVLGLNWKVCAAAVFLTVPPSHFGSNTHSYAAIKKSFGDWHRRKKTGAQLRRLG